MTTRGNRQRIARRWFVALFALIAGAGGISTAYGQSSQPAPEAAWESFRGDVFGERPIADAAGLLTIDAPTRAQDAAIVPIDLHFKPTAETGPIKSVTLIVDENPSPVAAVFTFGEDAGVTHLATRVRVNAYSYVRAVAETADGKLHMTQAFVKASGGCSAPALKNQDEAMASLGQMKMRIFEAKAVAGTASNRMTDMQIMIRHPNNSGLQMDQVTRYYIPAHFVSELAVRQGDRLVLAMEGGISISEDPNFRFEFNALRGENVSVEASDTEGKIFRNEWPLESSTL